MDLMRAHYFQHVPFEGLGSIQPWLDAAGYEVTCTRFFESARLPELDGVDFLIAMGGPMSVNDDDELPWLTPAPPPWCPRTKKRIRDMPGYTEICRDIVGCAPGVSAQ